MDYGRDSSGNVVHVIPTNTPPENWLPNDSSSHIWATEDDYKFESSVNSQSRSNSEQPPGKKSKNSSQEINSSSSSARSKAIGKMFFKTKLCCKFRAGTCPYITNCNFAHSIEELRRPPANWQEIVAAHEEEKDKNNGGSSVIEPPREEFQIPSLTYGGDSQRSYKGRHCKKFYTEEGCPYGDNCTFLHDEQSKNRESVAISLGPGGYGGGGGGGGSSGAAAAAVGGSSGGGGGSGSVVIAVAVGGVGIGGGGSGVGSNGAAGCGTGVTGQNIKPSNWKTRICNKWELTGYCPFGNKCHFAHGTAELHRYGGGLVDVDARDSPLTPSDSKQGGVPAKYPADALVPSVNLVSHSDVYHLGAPSQRISVALQRPGQRAHQKWKGPDKISRVYGDWIDDIE